ncbi:hypothetical protein PGRAN_09896 [Listeria grandensis FSL F6-0971]|uniref:Uncharacterized protein n=1 Tax=Listeria grandensis FSL F6-0971 TaxID=1265819 RepID=W7BB16_9LIST|nr:hypothetical protein PGRAN_09896 [Listeria grandensis FSL F6-0971]
MLFAAATKIPRGWLLKLDFKDAEIGREVRCKFLASLFLCVHSFMIYYIVNVIFIYLTGWLSIVYNASKMAF